LTLAKVWMIVLLVLTVWGLWEFFKEEFAE
jgi:hypothetical protein